MRTASTTTTSACALLVTLTLAGCGAASDGATSGSSSAGPAVVLQSPVVTGGANASIPRLYTCDGKDISLPLVWGEVPTGTAELAVLTLALTPVRQNGSNVIEKVAVIWAVTGLSPSLRELAAGRLPRGAIVGRSQSGGSRYSICPAKGSKESYLFALFALPHRLANAPGFSDQALFQRLGKERSPYGQLLASYKRA